MGNALKRPLEKFVPAVPKQRAKLFVHPEPLSVGTDMCNSDTGILERLAIQLTRFRWAANDWNQIPNRPDCRTQSNERTLLVPNGNEVKIEVKHLAIPATRRQRNPTGNTLLEKSQERTSPGCGMLACGEDRERTTQDLNALETEKARRGTVPAADSPMNIAADDRLGERFDEQTRPSALVENRHARQCRSRPWAIGSEMIRFELKVAR